MSPEGRPPGRVIAPPIPQGAGRRRRAASRSPLPASGQPFGVIPGAETRRGVAEGTRRDGNLLRSAAAGGYSHANRATLGRQLPSLKVTVEDRSPVGSAGREPSPVAAAPPGDGIG